MRNILSFIFTKADSFRKKGRKKAEDARKEKLGIRGEEDIKIAHRPFHFCAEDVISLAFRRDEVRSVQQREPAGSCRQHTYYTAFWSICKYSIVTKIGENFCEKAYEVEIYGCFDLVFWCFLR